MVMEKSARSQYRSGQLGQLVTQLHRRSAPFFHRPVSRWIFLRTLTEFSFSLFFFLPSSFFFQPFFFDSYRPVPSLYPVFFSSKTSFAWGFFERSLAPGFLPSFYFDLDWFFFFTRNDYGSGSLWFLWSLYRVLCFFFSSFFYLFLTLIRLVSTRTEFLPSFFFHLNIVWLGPLSFKGR